MQEATYNPFYAEVGVKLCTYHNRFKFTFQLALWDEVKALADRKVRQNPTAVPSRPLVLASSCDVLASRLSQPRRVFNISKMLARLFAKHVLSLSILKVGVSTDVALSPPRLAVALC